MARFRHLSHSTSKISIYLLIDCLSNACEFSNQELPLGKYTVVNLCSVFNLFNTLLIVSFLNSVPLSIKMNLDGPICSSIVSTYACITSSADFDFMGTAIRNDECRSMQVNIHLKPHLDLSNGPMQSRQMLLKGPLGMGRCLLSYLILCVACWQHSKQLFT